MEIRRTDGAVGAEVIGVDMAKPLSPDTVARLEQAFLDHQVLLFRDQPLTAQQLADFSAHFGPLQPHVQRRFRHPEVDEVVFMRNVDDQGNFDEAGARRGAYEKTRDGWHSDLSYDEIPAKATLLHSLEIPSSGGNTCFADAYRAFADMPEALKQRAVGLTAEFVYGGNTSNEGIEKAQSSLDDEAKAAPAVRHPVICRHPTTGKPAIYVNPVIATRIVDLPDDEGKALMAELFDWLDKPAYRWEQEWRVGDTLMWANLGGVMHMGRFDYPIHERRIFIRTTVRGAAIEPYQMN